jgi:hypothetical protein
MPKIDFSTIEDAKSFTPVSEGTYHCEIASVEQTTTGKGNEMWKLKLKILEGEHAGRHLFDNIVFTPAAMKRIKLVCSRLGLDTSGELDLTPAMIRGKQALVTVQIEEYVDDEGQERSRNKIPFGGYETAQAAGAEDDDAPF